MGEATAETSGLVLAGGESRRFGSDPKALATFEGRPLLERVVSTVSGSTGARPVVAVARPAQRRMLSPSLTGHEVRYVTDADRFDGPLAGIVGALPTISTPWVFVCGCDMPLLSGEVIEWLASRRADGVDATVLTTDGQTQPLHSIYRTDAVRRHVDSLPPAAGLHSLLDALGPVQRVAASDSPAGVAARRSVRNVNTRAELAALDRQ